LCHSLSIALSHAIEQQGIARFMIVMKSTLEGHDWIGEPVFVMETATLILSADWPVQNETVLRTADHS